MRKSTTGIARWLFLAGLVASAPSVAESVSGEGTVTYVPVASESLRGEDGKSIIRNHQKGVIIAADSAAPFHLATQDCRGTTVVSADGGEVISKGYCDVIDRDGDVWWLWYDATPQGSTWGILGGTGKYGGMTGGGTTKSEKPAPDGRFVMHWQGSWELR